jgi:hypothetical protein
MATDTLEQRVEKLLWANAHLAFPAGSDYTNIRARDRVVTQFREPLLAAFKALSEIDAASSYGKGSGPKMVEAKEKVRAVLAVLDQDGEGKCNG